MFSEFHDPLGVQFVGKQSVILYMGLISGLKKEKNHRFKIQTKVLRILTSLATSSRHLITLGVFNFFVTSSSRNKYFSLTP